MAMVTKQSEYDNLTDRWMRREDESSMVETHAKNEPLAVFLEKTKALNQKEIVEVLQLQRILEDIAREVECPQIRQIKVRSNQ